MDLNRWWIGDPDERYWLEITDRKDLGVDLHCPQRGSDGHEIWHYALVTAVQPGDIVFHYTSGDRATHSISAWSRAVGTTWSEPIAVAPQAGESAGVKMQPGWRLGLEGPFPLTKGAVDLDRIRDRHDAIARIDAQLVTEHGHPTYHPFELGTRPIRAVAAYLTKLPREVVALFDELAEANPAAGLQVGDTEGIGSPYRRVNESALVSKRDPFDTDPAVVERGLRAHAQIQNEFADFLSWHGIEPLSPRPSEPHFDLAFRTEHGLAVVEVKHLNETNQERQLRLGLGQVLRYADILRDSAPAITPVLALGRQPPADWLDMLERYGVTSGWPGEWIRLLPANE